ncbi:flotillin [Cladophialophora psammophila CBS 110553]|uniref:Flotillin n=1 Tax=Cladophialophora psammophila CBS 110553 TaxID=1182543 RepID=W9XW89_9EURO|nr:flotillin [Cladophialophora psammophila CBS 110553]EXJ74519.1 flotillin [Cladophialophora psammophila CBS 110553]
MWYHISNANEYLVVTGAGVDDVRIVKKAFVYPWQRVARISVSPFDFSLNLQAMTIEKLQFALPAVFTIGPDNKPEALKKYALLLSGNPDGTPSASKKPGLAIVPTQRGHVQDIVKGIIEGETRVIVSSMTMEEIFKERQVFKQKVIENVQNELDQFGLRIYNANVKELQDTPGSEYFAFLSRKAHEGASNQARIDVAEARMRGEIGEASKRGHTKQEISKIEAETAVLETKRRADKAQADAELTNRQTELDMTIQINQIQARRAAEARDAELQKEVETKKAATELERLRAKDLVRAQISKETTQQEADADLYRASKQADAKAYAEKQDADAQLFKQQRQIQASVERQMKEADAMYHAKMREAEATKAQAEAYRELADAFGGPQGLLQFMMLKENTYEKLAMANAKAIQGLQPKITVWNTGNGDASGAMGEGIAPIKNIMQSLPPLLSTIQEQTGITPPNWMVQMPKDVNGQLKPEERRKILSHSAEEKKG